MWRDVADVAENTGLPAPGRATSARPPFRGAGSGDVAGPAKGGAPHGATHEKAPTGSAWPYATRRWRKLRDAKRRASPLCEPCMERGRTVPMKVVDHRVAIRNGGEPFPPLSGLTSMCQACHNAKTRDDVHGAIGCDADGNPLGDEGWDDEAGVSSITKTGGSVNRRPQSKKYLLSPDERTGDDRWG